MTNWAARGWERVAEGVKGALWLCSGLSIRMETYEIKVVDNSYLIQSEEITWILMFFDINVSGENG